MKPEPKRNLPASVRQRLLTLSQRRKEPFDLVLVRYGIERLLYRLSRSPHAEKFLLKGAMLFAIWSDGTHRPTRDVDLLGSGPHDDETLKTIFTELCRLETEPDGLTFLPESVAAVLLAIPEILRFAAIPDAVAANLRLLIYGLLLVVMMHLRPQGLAGEYRVR